MITFTLDKILSARHMTPLDLVYKTDISYRTVCAMLENNCSSLDLLTLEKICDVLECSPEDVVQIKG